MRHHRALRRFAMLTLIVIASKTPAFSQTETREAGGTDSPGAVVAHWLELHRTGQGEKASSLSTGNADHRAPHLLPSNRDTGARVYRSLGNRNAAAVVTEELEKSADNKRLLLFWLVRHASGWRINESDSIDREVIDERLRGFLKAGDVRWHATRADVLGRWESGPCRTPGIDGVDCGSQIALRSDNQYSLLTWGPFAPPDPDEVDLTEEDGFYRGTWLLDDGVLLLTQSGRTYECRITWIDHDRLKIESADGKVRASYRRLAAEKRSKNSPR